MKKILFITTRNPFSGRFSGDVMRSSRIIELIKKKNKIDVAFLGDDLKKQKMKNKLFHFNHPNYILKIYYCFTSLLKLKPIQLGLFYSEKFKKFINDNAKNYDILFFYHIRSVQYLPADYRGRKILEMGDIYSDNYKQTYKNLSYFNPFFYFYFIESYLMKILENKSFKIFDKIILFSKKEINQVSKRFKNKILHIPESVNKILKKYRFSEDNHKILFIGNLGYLPNRLACLDFAKNVFPKISLKYPNIEFHIIGNIKKWDKYILSKNPKVKVLGQKSKIDGYIKNSICGLANLKIATGIQGKVLTYMSYGVPAICSYKTASNFGSNVMNYKSNTELLNHINNLKINSSKSRDYSKKSLIYVKKFTWQKISLNYLKLIKNSF